jgi:hypothetical protein
MLEMSPGATDDELAQRYTDYSAECYAILREPTVWSAIERVAAKLMERGKLRNYTNRASVFSSQVIDFDRSPDRCILMEASDSGLDDGVTLVQRAENCRRGLRQ